MFIVLSDFIFLVVEMLLGDKDVIGCQTRKHCNAAVRTLTASKLMSESTATDAALLSALFASRLNFVLLGIRMGLWASC